MAKKRVPTPKPKTGRTPRPTPLERKGRIEKGHQVPKPPKPSKSK